MERCGSVVNIAESIIGHGNNPKYKTERYLTIRAHKKGNRKVTDPVTDHRVPAVGRSRGNDTKGTRQPASEAGNKMTQKAVNRET